MAGTDTSIFGVGEVQIPGPPGPAPSLEVGTVTSSPTPRVIFTLIAEGHYRVYYEIPNGPQGPQGLKGDKGDQGARGEKGPQGDPGTIVAITTGTGLLIDNTDPARPEVYIDTTYKEYLDSLVATIIAGDYIVVDDDDPSTPTVSVDANAIKAVQFSSSDPSTDDIDEGVSQIWHNSSSNETKLWANIGGVLKSTELT